MESMENHNPGVKTITKLPAVLCLLMLVGCSDAGPSLAEIPRYPNAVPGESLSQSMGFMTGEIVQLTTADSFEQVLDFYLDALAEYQTETISPAMKDGRQTAINLVRRTGATTVVIQEYGGEDRVYITLMRVGT